ncbi:MAG: pantetheine-phosphate adenylyltransferase [Dehalococcoidales bacterium]|nr:pantetheine-phosphate adenylyltransferase [Dehalococcoidales bacterium]
MTVALYAGTFDPITYGHIDIAIRAAKLFDNVIVGIYDSTANKKILFSTEERIKLAKTAFKEMPNIEVRPFTGLVVDFAKDVGADTLVRGLRSTADFEYEFEMELMNKNLRPELELVYLMASLQFQFLSSSRLKEVAALGGNIENMVPKHVWKALKTRLAERKQAEE